MWEDDLHCGNGEVLGETRQHHCDHPKVREPMEKYVDKRFFRARFKGISSTIQHCKKWPQVEKKFKLCSCQEKKWGGKGRIGSHLPWKGEGGKGLREIMSCGVFWARGRGN